MPEIETTKLIERPTGVKKKKSSNISDWIYLPYELWFIILVQYGLTAKDLANLDYCCKWFSSPTWEGTF